MYNTLVVYSGISVGEIYEKRDRYRDERRKRTIRNGVPAIEGVREIVREREQRRVDTRTARVTERERDHRRVRVVRGCTALRWHGAREGDSPPLVTAAKRQDFPHRVHREMGADPCPQTEAGPTPPPEWCGGTRRHEVGRAEQPH